MRGKTGPVGFVRSLIQILMGRPQVPPSLEDSEVLRAILERRSLRRFAEREIPGDIFAAILEAGRLAPSTVNLQTWTFALFTPDSWRECFSRPIPFRARRAIVILADTHRARIVLDAFPRSPLVAYTVAVMNASLAAMNMTIAAEALGVSSIMLSDTGRTGLLDCGYLKERLELPDGVYHLTTVVFGYRRGSRPPMPPKLPLDQICVEGKYREAETGVMENWLAQMQAGYKASHPFSSFERQLEVYRSKISQAEADLRAMIFSA